MSLDTQARLPRVTTKWKVEFDASKQGGRRSLVWNTYGAGTYTHTSDTGLVHVGEVALESEASLHAFQTSDLALAFSNGDGTTQGFWDSAWSTFELAPLIGILCRLTLQIQNADGSYTDAPAMTGVVHDCATTLGDGDGTGLAHLAVTGIPSALTQESAEGVKDGDAWYRYVSHQRAVRLLLTQADRFVPAYGANVPCTITAAYSDRLVVARSDGGTWGTDTTGAHGAGVLAGYVVGMTSGLASNTAYVISRSVTTGTSSATVYLAGGAPSCTPGDTLLVTGYCWPFLDVTGSGASPAMSALYELSGFTLSAPTRLATQDGRYVLSRYGVPPEDGTRGVCEALAHDGTNTYYGVGPVMYRYSPATDSYAVAATLSPSTLQWRRAWYDNPSIYAVAWADDDTAVERTGYVFRLTPTMTNYTLTTANAYGSPLAHLVPGDLHYRKSQTISTGEFGAVGQVLGYSTSLGFPNVPVPQGSDVRLVDKASFPPSTYTVMQARGLLQSDSETSVSGTAVPILSTTEPWTYTRVRTTVGDISDTFAVQWPMGGSYQLHAIPSTSGLAGLYWWARDTAANTVTLQKFAYATGATTTVATLSAGEGASGTTREHPPVASWIDASRSILYCISHLWNGYVAGVGLRPVTRCEAIYLTTNTVATVWQSGTYTIEPSIVCVAGGDAQPYNGLACFAITASANDSALSWRGGSGPRQRYILAKNVQSPSFWSTFLAGSSNDVYVSRAPWTHFTLDTAAANASVWFLHHAHNALWRANNTAGGGVAGEVTGRLESTVPGDMGLASQLCITTEVAPRVLGVSTGEWPTQRVSTTPTVGQGVAWQFAPYHTPRIDVLDVSGLTRWQALSAVAELADYVVSDDAQGRIVFRPRDVATVDWTLDETTFRALGKHALRDEHCGRVECQPKQAIQEAPRWSFVPVHNGADGNPVEGKVFNGTIAVRQTDAAAKRLVLTCVTGNQNPYGDAVSGVTNTTWRVFNASANPQYTGDDGTTGSYGRGYTYPGGWWALPAGADGLSDSSVWVQLADATGGSVVPVGVSPGDQVIIECPGLQLRDDPAGVVAVQDGPTVADYTPRTRTISNPFVTRERAPDLCAMTLAVYRTLALELDGVGQLFPSYAPLDVVAWTVPLLGLAPLTGFIRRVTHTLSSSQITVRQYAAPAAITPQTYPTPRLPAAEPA